MLKIIMYSSQDSSLGLKLVFEINFNNHFAKKKLLLENNFFKKKRNLHAKVDP